MCRVAQQELQTLVLWPFHSVTTELIPVQRLRLRSVQTAALSEPEAGLRNPGLRRPAYATGGTARRLTA